MGQFTRDLTEVEREYLRAFDESLRTGGDAHRRREVLLELLLVDAGLDPWRVLGTPRSYRVRLEAAA